MFLQLPGSAWPTRLFLLYQLVSRKLIRIGLRRAPDAQRRVELSHVLAGIATSTYCEFQGAQMLMRVACQCLFYLKVEAKPVLHWQAARTSQGALKLSLTNNGNAHIQIKNFKLSLPGSRNLG